MPSVYTAQRIILAARDRHPEFDEQAHPDAVCLRWLSNYQQTLLGQLALLDDELVVQTVVASLPLPNFFAGITLPPHQYLKLPQAVMPANSQPVPITLVPFEHRFDRQYPAPAACESGDVLVLLGEPGDWSGVSAVQVRYVPTAAALVALSDTFLLPDTAEPLCVAALARFLGGRAAALGATVNVGVLAADESQAGSVLFDQIAMRRRAETDLVREVW